MANAPTKTLPRGEFVVLIAILTSQVALSIDAMLPALPAIGLDLRVSNENDPQLVISLFLIGLAIGQFLAGPLSDAFGRRPIISGGLVLFMAGCILSNFATDLNSLLIGRFLQGVGAAGPRIATMALVRDQYEGRAMAQIMSIVMTIFIIVPALAPALGQGVMMVADWRAIFSVLLAVAVFALAWFYLRQPETLAPDLRRPLKWAAVISGFREVFTHRTALGYTIAAGFSFGSFVGYLNSSQQIFEQQFGIVGLFPLYFSILTLAIGAASIFNSRRVMQLGMRYLAWRGTVLATSISVVFFVLVWFQGGQLALWQFMVWGLASFFCMGLLFGNFNALALEPMGHIAGIASAGISSVSTLMATMLGSIIGQMYDGTVLPLIGGFAGLGLATMLIMHWANGGAKSA